MVAKSPTARAIVLRNLLLLLLACVAGYVDALSYLGLERVFTANMTGNTVLLGLALVQADRHAALRSGVALAGFLGGAALGARVVGRGQSTRLWPPAVTMALTLELVLLGAFALLWQVVSRAFDPPMARYILIVLAALAMGMQSAAVRRLDVWGIASTYLTGTLTSLVTRLVAGRRARPSPAPVSSQDVSLQPGSPPQPTHGAGLLTAVWLVYISGAMVAAAAPALGQTFVLGFPSGLMGLVIVTATVYFRGAGRTGSV